MRIILVAVVLALIPSYSKAQLFIEPATDIFTPPVKGEQKLKKELFELPVEDYNHSFKAALPGDNYLIIDFDKMSYWPEPGILKNIFDIAGKTIAGIQDSFQSELTSKKVDIHVPIKNNPLTVRLKEHNDGTDLLVLNHDQQNPLKLGMDTIRVKKTFNIQTDEEGVDTRSEILYTFILKDLQQIENLHNNTALIDDISNTFDSVVQIRRTKWSNEDLWYHEMHVSYNPMEEKGTRLKTYQVPGFLKGYDFTAYVGASLFRNELAPNVEIGIGYKWPSSTTGNLDYVRASLSGVSTFERVSPTKFNMYGTSFVNIEVGSYINRKDTWIPLYQTSFGFGYMYTDEPSLKPYTGIRMFFNYSLSPSVRITPDFYYLFKKGLDPMSWVGLTVSLRIL